MQKAIKKRLRRANPFLMMSLPRCCSISEEGVGLGLAAAPFPYQLYLCKGPAPLTTSHILSNRDPDVVDGCNVLLNISWNID